MKKFNLLMASLLLAFCNSSVFAQSDFQVLSESSGLKKIKVTNQAKEQLFNNAVTQNSETTNDVRISNTGVVVSVNSLRGLKAAGLPLWVETEVLAEYGYGSWLDVPEQQLDVIFEALTYDMDAILQVAYEDLILSGDASSMSYSQQVNAVQAQGFSLRKCFKSSWKEDSKAFDKSFNNASNKSYSTNSGYINLNAQTNITATGSLKGGFYYKAKSRCGIPYKIRFQHADVNADANISGLLKSTGSASYSDSKIFNLEPIRMFEYTQSWWFYIFQFDMKLKAQFDLGLKVAAAAAVNYEATYDTKGVIGITWRCTKDECIKSRNIVDLTFNDTGATNYSAQVKVEVVPFADANFSADIDMYWGALDIANAKIGVVAATPITYFGYYGNMCSDADKDGTNEIVSASLIDGYGMLYAYRDVNALGKKKRFDLDLGLSGNWRKTSEFDIRATSGTKLTVYSKHLYYKDLNGQSSVIQPVFLSDTNIAINQPFSFSKRSCHPFSDAVTYEVNWGDGTANTLGSATSIAHNWAGTGTKTIYARLVEDAFGRKLNGKWVSKAYTVTGAISYCAMSGLAGRYVTTGYGSGTPSAASQATNYCGVCGTYGVAVSDGGTAFYCKNASATTSSISTISSSRSSSSLSSCAISGRSGAYYTTAYSSGIPSAAQAAGTYCGSCGTKSLNVANGGVAFYCN